MLVFDVLPEAHFHLRSLWQATSETSTQWQNSRKQTRQTRQNTHTNTLSAPVLDYNEVHLLGSNFKVLYLSISIFLPLYFLHFSTFWRQIQHFLLQNVFHNKYNDSYHPILLVYINLFWERPLAAEMMYCAFKIILRRICWYPLVNIIQRWQSWLLSLIPRLSNTNALVWQK